MAAKHARLAELPPSGPSRLPENHNDHHHDDENDEEESGNESDFDETTVKTEGGLASKLESLDERAFEDKKKVALREEILAANGGHAQGAAGGTEEEDEGNAGELSSLLVFVPQRDDHWHFARKCFQAGRTL